MTVRKATAVGALVLMSASALVVAWLLWGGGGPLVWLGIVRPAYIPPDYMQSGGGYCSPLSEGAMDQVCLDVLGPVTHDPEQAYGGDHDEYVRVAGLTSCAELQAYVEQTEAELVAGGPLAGRDPQPGQGYVLAAGLRQAELNCFG